MDSVVINKSRSIGPTTSIESALWYMYKAYQIGITASNTSPIRDEIISFEEKLGHENMHIRSFMHDFLTFSNMSSIIEDQIKQICNLEQ